MPETLQLVEELDAISERMLSLADPTLEQLSEFIERRNDLTRRLAAVDSAAFDAVSLASLDNAIRAGNAASHKLAFIRQRLALEWRQLTDFRAVVAPSEAPSSICVDL